MGENVIKTNETGSGIITFEFKRKDLEKLNKKDFHKAILDALDEYEKSPVS